MSVEIVTRDGWGAKAPRHYPGRGDVAADIIFMTETYGRPCSGGGECCAAVRKLQAWNMVQQGKTDICYNFVIAGDGRAYEGRGWDNHPDLPFAFKRSRRGLSLGFIGNYNDGDLPAKMVQAMVGLIEYGRAAGLITPDHRHHSLLTKLYPPVWSIMPGDPVVVSDSDSDSGEDEDGGLDQTPTAEVNISQLEVMNKTRLPKQPWFHPTKEEDKSYQDEWSEDYS